MQKKYFFIISKILKNTQSAQLCKNHNDNRFAARTAWRTFPHVTRAAHHSHRKTTPTVHVSTSQQLSTIGVLSDVSTETEL